MRLRLVLAALLLVVFDHVVHAEWKPQYASQPIEVQMWYRNAELTKAAQGRFPFKKCCDNSDVVHTKFRVDRTTAKDVWEWLDGATWRVIPEDIIHWNEHAPNKQPTLFIYAGKETCFFPGEEGI